MSKIFDSLKNENCIRITDCLVDDIRKKIDEVHSDVSQKEILEIISEMVEITSTQLSENNERNPVELVTEIVADNPVKETIEQKPQNNTNVIAENDLPVRRSNRIRKSAVKKDEYVVPRTKKANRSHKTNDMMDLKLIEKNISNLKNAHKNNESPNLKSVEVDSKQASSGKIVNEPLNKVLSNKLSKSKESKPCSKVQKVRQKAIQNEKRNTQTEKKKPLRQKKKCDKSRESTDLSGTNTIDSECKKDEKAEILTLQPQTLPSSKILDNVSNPDDNKSENIVATAKSSDDHSCDTIEKLPESCNTKPVKVKSRWLRSSELEAVMNSELINSECTVNLSSATSETVENQPNEGSLENVKEEIPEEIITEETKVFCLDSASPVYDHIEENIYRFNRKKCKSKKQVRRMVCDCTLTKEEQEYGVLGCKEECLNRLLMIECGSRCPIGEACSNKKFQKKEYVKAEIFKTEKKGWGLRTLEDISAGDFLIEFVGEILNHKEYRQRVKQYAKEKNVHSYFMAMKPDEILDATVKGNLSRFINHSCYPNCETQKWTVNGELRVGVFSKQALHAGEELTLDYKFQRYGREAQKCYCGAENCSGFIGGAKQISIDAYSGKSIPSRKRKGSEDKKREWEDLILEEEIEKLNGNRGLRNREDTLKLARLMVRADDATSRHQLLNIILKTEEQACLRLFLDYHGLPLLWSWMADVTELELKAKILQVLSLLPISNKTMLLDSKVMSIVEKWHIECASKFQPEIELEAGKSSPAVICEETSDSVSKKLKLPDLSDSETDSTSSHTVVDASNETNSIIPDMNTKGAVSTETVNSHPESFQENPNDGKQLSTVEEDPRSSLKINIASLASGLLNNWKNLKEVFRIPRLEQQKRKEDEMEVDNNAKEKVETESIDDNTKCGDQIQVVISGKNVFSDHHRAYDYEQPEVKLEDCPRRFCQPRISSVLAKPRQVIKPVRRHVFPKQIETEISQHKPKEEIPKGSGDILPSTLPPGPMLRRPPLIAAPPFSNQPPITYPPPANVPVPPHQPVENPSSLIYPPHIMYPQSQLPFVGSPAPVLPHNPAAMPPPTSVTSQPPLIQQPPMNAGMPPCQPIPPNQPNVGGPPNPNSFLLPPNVPPSSVVPGTSQFIPNQTPPIQTFPPGGNVFTNQNQPLYFLPPPTSLPNNHPPAATFTENVPIQQPTVTFPVQTVVPVKEEHKPVKLPKNWRTATDSEGNVYYYHSITRQTQWDPPSEEEDSDDDDDDDSNSEESESSDTPTYDEPKVISSKHSKKKSKKRKPTKAAADTSVVPIRPEVAKKIKELFRTKMSSFIVHCLNAYRKPDCTVGRITSNDDFKYLARKLTHYTMTKELKQCKNVEDLDCNETVMHKAKDFIKKYMAKYGSQYIRKEKLSPAEE